LCANLPDALFRNKTPYNRKNNKEQQTFIPFKDAKIIRAAVP